MSLAVSTKLFRTDSIGIWEKTEMFLCWYRNQIYTVLKRRVMRMLKLIFIVLEVGMCTVESVILRLTKEFKLL